MLDRYKMNWTGPEIISLCRSDCHRSSYPREMAGETEVDVKLFQIQLQRLERKRIFSSSMNDWSKILL
jgi:hypothetical protein